MDLSASTAVERRARYPSLRRRNAGTSSSRFSSDSTPSAGRAAFRRRRRCRRRGAMTAARAPGAGRSSAAAAAASRAGGAGGAAAGRAARQVASCSCAGPRASARRASRRARDARTCSKPVAITVILTRPFSVGSTTAPKMMLASSCAASWMMVSASFTSISDMSGPPVTLMMTPRAPLTEASSSSGLEMARCAASIARDAALADRRCPSSPRPCPT